MVAFILGEATTIFYAVVVIASLVASFYLAKSLKKDTQRDDQPDNTATRGAIVPRVLGRRMVGSVVTWIDPKPPSLTAGAASQDGGVEGGKGGGGGSTATEERYQAGMHVLAQGPIAALWSIREGGVEIFRGPITPYTHPSGSSVTCPNNKGTFRIYWGDGWAIDTALQNANNFGKSDPTPANWWMSTFNLFCYVVWDKKNLGPSTRWPQLNYEIDGPCFSKIGRTSPRIKQSVLDAEVWTAENWSASFGDLSTYGDPNIIGSLQQFQVDLMQKDAPAAGDFFIDITGFPHSDPSVSGSNGFDCSKYFHKGAIIRLAGAGTAMSTRARGDFWPELVTKLTDTDFPNNVFGANETQYWEVEKFEWLPSEPRWAGHPKGPSYGFLKSNGNPGVGVNRIWLKEVSAELRPNLYKIINKTAYWPTGSLNIWCGVMPFNDEDGINPIHALDDILFSKWPYGAGLPREHYDLDSMEDVAELMNDEQVGMNILLDGGKTYQDAAKEILANLGMFISWDRKVGKFKFIPLRQPAGTVEEIPDTALVGAPPQIETTIDNEVQRSTVVFAFDSRNNNYRTMTVAVKDDGQAVFSSFAEADEIRLEGVTSLTVAQKIAMRREQEAYTQPTGVELDVSREVGFMAAGAVFKVPNDETIYRALSIQPDLLSSRVKIAAAADQYGVPLFGGLGNDAAESLGGAPGKGQVLAAASDLDVQIIELPRMFFQTLYGSRFNPMAVAVLRVRAQENEFANIYLSRDGSSYTTPIQQAGYATGGRLTTALAANSPWMMDDDASLLYSMPECSELGIDMLKVENLVGSGEASWKAGRQICILTDGASIEICYLRGINVTASGYSLSGLIRGRMGTAKQAWAIGTRVYIFRLHQIEVINHPLVVPGKALHVKVQPVAAGGAAPDLSALDPVVETPQGASLRPLAPAWISTDDSLPIYRSGGDILLRWSYGASRESFRTPAGLQSAGEPYEQPPPAGQTTLQFVTFPPIGAVVHSVDLEGVNNYTVDNQDLIQWFGGEPSQFEILLTQTIHGYQSPPVSLVLTKQGTAPAAVISEVVGGITLTRDSDSFTPVDASTGPGSVTLPPASIGSKYGLVFHIKKMDPSANHVIVYPAIGELLEGDTSKSLTDEGVSIRVVSDGTNWHIT